MVQVDRIGVRGLRVGQVTVLRRDVGSIEV